MFYKIDLVKRKEGRLNIHIVTVNVPKTYLKAMEVLTKKDGMYPSRSELIRVAVREFLIRELKAMDSFKQYNSKPKNVSNLFKSNVKPAQIEHYNQLLERYNQSMKKPDV